MANQEINELEDEVILDGEEVVVDEDEVEEIEEATAAAASLKPNSKPADPKSKIGMMQNVLGAMNGLSKQDLTAWFDQAMAQFGPGKTYGVGDNSAKNAASIDAKTGKGPKTKDAMPKLNVKEDIEDMFVGSDLSEEFKESAATLFEAAVSARLIAETARLEEEYETALNEEIENIGSSLSAKLDTYLDYVVENWMEENKIAIESTLRNELAEEFIEGLKNLFSEHYINVPENKIDVMEALAEKVEMLESKLDEVITENHELKDILAEEAATSIFEELASDLAMTQKEKFAALAEGIEFDGDIERYSKKLNVVKETYFGKINESSYSGNNIENETFEGTLAESVTTDPTVNRYVQAIARTVKK